MSLYINYLKLGAAWCPWAHHSGAHDQVEPEFCLHTYSQVEKEGAYPPNTVSLQP